MTITAPRPDATRVPAPPERQLRAERTLTVPAMGGSLTLRVAHRPRAGDAAARALVARDLARVAARVDRWAARLTRYTGTSDLAALNADPAATDVVVRPTLGAMLDWAERAVDLCPGLLDVTLLDERLAAEADTGDTGDIAPASLPLPPGGGRSRWHLVRRPRGGLVVRRGTFRFDLDGVAKGAIADRALGLLRDYPAAMVDADGDIALRLGDGTTWDIAVADPRRDGDVLGLLRLDGRLPGGLVGVATSGTSVHRWPGAAGGPPRHHLLDPRSRRPAITDVVQVTVIAGSAREAEVLAKAAVIAGSEAGMELLDRPGVAGALLLLDDGTVVAHPRTGAWLA
jgi:thiamine biosynthesis lipoprotein